MYRVLMIVSSWHLLNFLQDASSAKVRAARARTESRWHAESNTDNRITWLGTKILQHVFFVGHVCLIIDFYFKPIFIQLPERICLFICSYLLQLWEVFFCRTAMQKRSEEAVFFTSSEVRGTQVPRYPGTQVEMEEMDSPSISMFLEAYNKQKEKLFVFVYSSDTNWSGSILWNRRKSLHWGIELKSLDA